jgi:hypothetical protein
MATVHPASRELRPTNAGEYAERELILLLETGLSANYQVFHNVHWAASHRAGGTLHGELDVIVANGEGQLLVIELKAGDLTVDDGKLYKDYGGEKKDVLAQFNQQRSNLRARLKEAGLDAIHPQHLLVLADFRISNPHQQLSITADELVDATQYPEILFKVREILPERTQTQRGKLVSSFLMNHFELIIDIDHQKASLAGITRQLSEGLATWVPRITAPSGLYLISATAGCGKTQMSVGMLNQAAAERKRCLYVCFNRPLADRLRAMVPPAVEVSNYDELCMNHYRKQVGEPDFDDPLTFSKARQSFMGSDTTVRYDLLMVDEAQDFEPPWVEHLLSTRLSDTGVCHVLEDEEQRIYPRQPFVLTEAVRIRCDDNFRSPQNLVALIKLLKLSQRNIRARSTHADGLIETLTYHNEKTLLSQTAAMIDHFINAGFKAEDILVLSGHGLKNAALLQADQAGSHQLKRFTGRYDAAHEPVWTEGDVVADSVYRAKGQSAPAVILTELDYEGLDEKAKRLLFVGMTRASMALGLIMTEKMQEAIQTAAGI